MIKRRKPMRKKAYSLEVEEILEIDSTHVSAYLSKGHHHKRLFAYKVIKKMKGIEAYKDYDISIVEAKTQHVWGHTVPREEETVITYSATYKRNYFPLTIIRV